MYRVLSRLWRERDGQDLIEYALLTAAISLGGIAAIGNVGAAVQGRFAEINEQVAAAGNRTSGGSGSAAAAPAPAGGSGTSPSPSTGNGNGNNGSGAGNGGGNGSVGGGNRSGSGNTGNGRGNGS